MKELKHEIKSSVLSYDSYRKKTDVSIEDTLTNWFVHQK